MSIDEKLAGIDFEKSYLLNVIYDDESLTLEMDYAIKPGTVRYVAPEAGANDCFRKGFIRFADIAHLRLDKAKPKDGSSAVDLSVVFSAEFHDDYIAISCGWGEIEVTAQSIRVSVD